MKRTKKKIIIIVALILLQIITLYSYFEEHTALSLIIKNRSIIMIVIFVMLALTVLSLVLKQIVSIKLEEINQANMKLQDDEIEFKKLNLESQVNQQELIESEIKYRTLVSNVPGAIFRCNKDKDWTIEFITKEIESITGYKAQGFINNKEQSYYSIVHKEDKLIYNIAHKSSADKGKYRWEYRIIHANGSIRWISENSQGVFNDEGEFLYIYGIINDITDLKQMEKLLFMEKEQFKTTLLSVGDGVISIDNKRNVVMLNKVAEQLTGWRQEEAIGRPIEEVFNIMNGVTRERCENSAQKVLGNLETIGLWNDTILISKGGREIPIEDISSPIKDEHENINGMVLVFRDCTEKKEKQEKIEYLIFHDQLTGVYNRKFYEEELLRVDNQSNLAIGFVMFDVNGLKLINDAFGHQFGDRILIKFVDILKKQCHPNHVIARIGGDEFVVLMNGTNKNEIQKLIQTIHEAIKSETMDNITLSVSSGFALKETALEEMDEIFKKAEDDMYRRKLYESGSVRHETIKVIFKTLYEKSKREEGHSKRVSHLCAEIGTAMGLGNDNIGELRTAGLMHDIGKITIDDEILNKPELLSEFERQQIKRHPEVGYNILRSVSEYGPLAEYVLAHHERWDGRGYPKGLKGEDIPLQARIISVGDSYDAMTSDRAYRKGLSKEIAREELERNAGHQFDANIVEVFLDKVLEKV